MALRERRKEAFTKRHGVGLGIASFFVKAAVAALKAFPRLNAEIQGEEMVLKHYYDIGIAVGASRGWSCRSCATPTACRLPASSSPSATSRSAPSDNTLTLEDLKGGTFTITNGGVFGSLLSTPILNPPQVGILGLHKIEDRPVAIKGQVVIRPMMYLALSYDHRIVDGLEAVQFLVKVKEFIEDPATCFSKADATLAAGEQIAQDRLDPGRPRRLGVGAALDFDVAKVVAVPPPFGNQRLAQQADVLHSAAAFVGADRARFSAADGRGALRRRGR